MSRARGIRSNADDEFAADANVYAYFRAIAPSYKDEIIDKDMNPA